jgi:phosphohistidine phosphatase
MRCYFLRHGLAVDPEQWEGDDADRPLTAEGKERMAREARTIAALSLELDAILTSPLLRAKQTAGIVADKMKIRSRLVEDRRLGFAFGARALAEIFRERSAASAIMLVGHEPSMSRTIGEVIGGARVDFKKGSLACVSFDEPSALAGELVWLVPPKVLALS